MTFVPLAPWLRVGAASPEAEARSSTQTPAALTTALASTAPDAPVRRSVVAERPAAVGPAGEARDRRVVGDAGAIVLGIEGGVDADALRPVELVFGVAHHAGKPIGIAQMRQDRFAARLLGAEQRPLQRHAARIEALEQGKPKTNLPERDRAVAVEREVEGDRPHALGRAGARTRTGRASPGGQAPRPPRTLARAPQRIQHRAEPGEVGKAAILQAARAPRGGAGKIVLLQQDRAVAGRGQMIGRAAADDSAADDRDVEGLHGTRDCRRRGVPVKPWRFKDRVRAAYTGHAVGRSSGSLGKRLTLPAAGPLIRLRTTRVSFSESPMRDHEALLQPFG